MKKRTLTVLVVVLVCTFLTACSKEIDTVTESVNEKESNVIKNPTVLEDTIEIVFPEQFEGLSGYDEEALVDYLKENSDGNYQKIECIDGQVNMVATQEEIEYWKGYVEKHIDDQKAVLTGINQKYDMCCNDSYNLDMKDFAKEILLEENYNKFIRSYKFTFWFQLIGVLAGFIVPSVVLLVIFKEFIYCAFGATIGIFWMCVWMLLSMVIPPTRIYRKFAKWYRKSDVSIRDLDEIFY